MDEAAELADRVGIMDHGRLLALDTPAALTRGLTGQAVLDVTVAPAAADTIEGLLEALTELAGVERGEPVARQQPAFAAAGPGGFGGRPGSNGGGPRPGGPGGPGGLRPDGHRDGGEVRLRLYLRGEPAVLLGPVVAVLAGRGAALSDVHIGEPTLEDVFIDLTGRGLR
jgi:ABC-2 type transport system ATP-binding protein